MDFAQTQRNPGKHAFGFGIVVVMHLLLGWALVSGLAQRMVEVIKGPIETKIIEETKPPPPPPPENLPPPPKFAPPPPSFVPPPEVNVNPPPTPAPTITTVQTPPPPAPVTIAPPPPPPVVAVAPPAPKPAPPPPAPPARTEPKLDFNVCEKPEYTPAAARADAQGTTVITFTMGTDGVITEAEVTQSSGSSREHKALDRAALAAVKACKGKPGTVDGKAEKLTSRVSYVWKLN